MLSIAAPKDLSRRALPILLLFLPCALVLSTRRTYRSMSYAWLRTRLGAGLAWCLLGGATSSRQRSVESLLKVVSISEVVYLITTFIGGVAQGQVIARLSLCSKVLYRAVQQSSPLPFVTVSRTINTDHFKWMVMRGRSYVLAIDADHTDDVHVTDAELALVAMHCKGVTSVSLVENKRISDDGIIQLCEGCRGIELLSLRGLWISDTCLLNASQYLRQLSSIDVMNCTLLSDSGILAIAQNCPILTSIDISHIVVISDASVAALAGHCARLEHICAVRCTRITNLSCYSLGEGACRHTLRSINFSRTAITDEGVTFLAQTVANLSSLDVTHNERITDVGIAALSLLNGLKRLRLSWCTYVTDASVGLVATRCSQLRELSVRDCFFVTEASLGVVRQRLPLCEIFDF